MLGRRFGQSKRLKHALVENSATVWALLTRRHLFIEGQTERIADRPENPRNISAQLMTVAGGSQIMTVDRSPYHGRPVRVISANRHHLA